MKFNHLNKLFNVQTIILSESLANSGFLILLILRLLLLEGIMI
jgi:hypothetical protein